MPVTEYLWDDVNDCVLEETDELGATQVTYTHEPGSFGPLVSEYRSGTTYNHHYDALGSTTLLTDDTGTVTDTFQYDAWGNQIARTGTTPTIYTWVGRWGYQDDAATTGGYYIRARTYRPTVARWAAADPISDYRLLLFIYQYASNGPSRTIDPSGLIEFTNSSNIPFNSGLIIGTACGPDLDEGDRTVTWRLTPQEKRDKVPKYFSQLVTIEIEITTSCPDPELDCTANAGAGVTCCNNTYRYNVHFYEALENKDQQPCAIDKKVWAYFLSKCKGADLCCDYSYHSITTKELTPHAGLGNSTSHYIPPSTKTSKNPEAFYKCCKMKEEAPDGDPPIATAVRESGRSDPSLVHPFPYNKYGLWVSEKEVNVTSKKCMQSAAQCTFSGYARH